MPTAPSAPTAQPVDTTALKSLVAGRHSSPHSVLGPHLHDGAVTVRTLRPLAKSVTVVSSGARTVMTHEFEGIWVAVLPDDKVGDYRLEVQYEGGEPHTVDDPYRYLPTLGEVDQHLIN
jgi:1,4-alpha-glucan branching enzyme